MPERLRMRKPGRSGPYPQAEATPTSASAANQPKAIENPHHKPSANILEPASVGAP